MIQCKVCGKNLKRLRLHLKKAHNMSVRSYAKYYPNAPLVDPEYAEKARLATLSNGTATNIVKLQKGDKIALKNKEE